MSQPHAPGDAKGKKQSQNLSLDASMLKKKNLV